MKSWFVAMGVLAAVASTTVVRADAVEEGLRLMRASEQATKSATEATRYRMELLGADGKLVQARELQFHFKKLPGKESTLVRFLAPAAIEGTGLLIEDGGRSANDVWLYLPATRRLRRIAGAEKTNWFMGTEFTHEDFEDYQLHLYRFERQKEAACGAGTCDVVAATPADAAERKASGYARKVYYVDRASRYPVRIEYYGRDGKLAKTLIATGMTRHGGYWRPQQLEMHNLANGRRTRLRSLSRTLDESLDDFLVSPRYLRAD